MLIKGTDLNDRQRAQVLAAFVHRHHAIGVGRFYLNDSAWLEAHSFHFLKDGSRLMSNRRHCEPAWMAEEGTPRGA